MFYLHRVTIIDGSSGIGFYNNLFKVWCFIGITTNLGLCLFSNPELRRMGTNKKFVIFFILENLAFVISYFVNWRVIPICNL